MGSFFHKRVFEGYLGYTASFGLVTSLGCVELSNRESQKLFAKCRRSIQRCSNKMQFLGLRL
jgi:hypothetical protein